MVASKKNVGASASAALSSTRKAATKALLILESVSGADLSSRVVMPEVRTVGARLLSSDRESVAGTTWWGWIGRAILGLSLYLGAAGIGLEMALWRESAPLIWPPAGIALVLVLRGGWSYLAVVAMGAFLVRIFEGGGTGSGVVYASAYTSSAGIAALVLKRFAGFQVAMERLTDVVAFIGVAVLGLPLLSAAVTTWAIVDANGTLSMSRSELFGVRWLSDALGVLVIAPITLVWFAKTRINWRNTQAAEVLGWLMILIFLGAMIFRNWAPTDTLRYPLELAMFPLMAWAAIRFGQRGATTGILIVSMMAVWELRDVIGPDASNTISQPPGYLWLFVGVLSVTALFLAAVLTEHKNREDEVRVNEERLRALIQAMPDLAFLISEDGRYLEVFVPKTSAFAEQGKGLQNKTLSEVYPPDVVKAFSEVIRNVLSRGEVGVHRYPIRLQESEHWFEARVAPVEPIEGQPRSVIWVAYDITASHRAIEALRDRDRLLQAVTQSEAALLKSTDYALGRREALKLLGEGIGLDGLAVYQAGSEDDGGAYLLLERWASELAADAPVPARLETECFGEESLQAFKSGKFVAFEDPSAFPPRLRERMETARVDHALWLPVFTADRFWGLLLVARGVSGRPWSESDHVILTSFATSFGGFVNSQQIEEALVQAKHQADAANSAKSEFLAMMSHEIRTPMNAILGFADILAQSSLSAEQTDYLKIINRSGKDLLELINNILDFSKLESAPIELDRSPLRIETTVMEVLEIMLMKAREKGVDLEYTVDDSSTGVYLGDALRLRQILLNLVSNAVKFTQKGRIAVDVHSEPMPDGRHRVHFVVTDTGIGIPEEALERLFEAFTQVDSSTTRQYGGTGLGLTISRRLAESMDGGISVESTPGVGSVFHVEVCLTSTDDFRELGEGNASQILEPRFAEQCPLRILLAEDDPVNTRLAIEVLERLGYQPDHAEEGAAAALLLRERTYNVAILDVQMAHLDGLKLTRMLRAGEFGEGPRGVYVIALTAMARKEDKIRCLDAGADFFLSKPFAMGDLKTALREAYQRTNNNRNTDFT